MSEAVRDRLLRAAEVEHEIARRIEALRRRHAQSASSESEHQIEVWETRHSALLEEIIELQLLLEPRKPCTPGLVGRLKPERGRRTSPTR